ncbi:FAD binding domain-containing [Fusarium albosuccineum]|uniref:FAD binding domain-containing n=1 Tax=Fusarium albosuccineum TaxID=1237068 RepID=A0A8H4LEZ1_9HYPO|nr:FAD binding domain-containing [Fusarium albosuccineum]
MYLKLQHFLALAASMGAIVTAANPPGSLEKCLQEAVSGDAARVQFSYEPGFEENDVRPYNLNYQRKPVAVLYPNTSTEVSKIVQCTAKTDRKLHARSGGNDLTNTSKHRKVLGSADGAVVVDLKNFQKLEVDEVTGVATVGSGIRLKHLVEGLHTNGGRYMPAGASAGLGVGGLTLVGGVGLNTRLEGAMIDTIVKVKVVLANGTVVNASASENSDLFWAIRGAGASFGIVTEFQFQTQPEPKEVIDFAFTVSSNDTATLTNAFKAYHEIIRDRTLDPRLGVVVVVSKNSFRISGAYFGPREGYDRVDFGSRVPSIVSGNVSETISWSQHVNNTFAECGLGGANWFVLMDLYGGAIGKPAVDAMAFPHRDIAYFFSMYATTENRTAQATYDFVDDVVFNVQEKQPEKYLSYVGYTNDRVEGSPQERYWGSNLPRLQNIKAAYDSKDLFSTAHTVKTKGQRH